MTRHFLVIGAQRCGTTWLHHQLDAHPQIAMARPTRPEPKVFLDDLGPGQDHTWYVDTWFAHATPGQVLGEKSTSYVDRPDAIARVRALLGDVPLVVQLRDPVARAVSHWRFSRESGLEERSLSDALSANLEGPLPWDARATSVSPYAYLERGRYAEALRPWVEAFGDLLRVQLLEDLLARPSLLADTLAHVGVDPALAPQADLTPVNRSRPEDAATGLDPAIEAAVRQSFAQSDQELEALLGRSLPWVAPAQGTRRGTTPVTDFRDHPDPIRFNVPSVEGNELAYLEQSLRDGHTSSSGPFSKRAAEILQQDSGAEEVMLTTSCTAALELSAMLLDLHPGDTVIVPSFTFSTSALAFASRGAELVFCDIEATTLGLDPKHLAELLDDSVRAVVVVHYGGVACDLEGISAVLADRPDVVLIEDNAHGLFGRWKGQPLGSFGSFTSLSFHETKNFTCGEGGALLVNDPAAVDRARVLYDKGTNRRAFFLGQVDKYSWVDTGSSFGMADLLAATLLAQLEQRDRIQAKRRHVYESYLAALAPYADLGVTLPSVPEGCDPAWHLFYVLMPDKPTRDTVMEAMRQEGINPTFHYVPLHSSIGGRRFAARETDCPVTTDVSERLMRLPFYNALTDGQIGRIVESFARATQAAVG